MKREVYTPEEAAEMLKVEVSTIRAWLRAGTLTGIKLGGVWRVRETDIATFLNDAGQPGQ